MADQQRSAAPVAIAVLAILSLPVLYVLSTGPVVLLMERGYINPEWVDAVYYPIEIAMNAMPWFNAAMTWYLELFV
jgi:hypothetical protein